MNQMNKPIYPSHELSGLLQEFILDVVNENPDDIVDHAANYFQQLNEQKKKREHQTVPVNKEGDIFLATSESSLLSNQFRLKTPNNRLLKRRNSVAGEHYEPNLDVKYDAVKETVYPKSQEARQRLESAVQDIFIFKSCSEEQMDKILNAMFERVVYAGETIIRQDDVGDNFYVIDKGNFDVLFEYEHVTEKLGCLKEPGSFGELALMYNCPRSATIQATCDGILWILDRFSFKRILVDTTERKRRHYEHLLENVPVLSLLTAYERTTLADALETRDFQDDEWIIRQGDTADCMFFMESGTVEVCVRDSKDRTKNKIISQVGKGEYFGEMALLNKTNRVASVRATCHVTCAVLNMNAFERLLGPCKDLMKRNLKKYEDQRRKLGIKEMPPKPRS